MQVQRDRIWPDGTVGWSRRRGVEHHGPVRRDGHGRSRQVRRRRRAAAVGHCRAPADLAGLSRAAVPASCAAPAWSRARAAARAATAWAGRPAAISVAEVMAAVEEDMRMTRCGGEAAKPCMAGQRCLTHGLWDALGEQIASFLESVTLQEVIDGIPGRQAGRAAPCRLPHRPRLADRAANEPRRAHISTGTRRRRCGREARAAMLAALDVVGNPSSLHAEGRRARAHHRGGARAGCGAGRRQAGRGGLHQRRHGRPTMPCWPPAGTRSCCRHRARLVLAPARASPARESIDARRRQRRRRRVGDASAAAAWRSCAAAARCVALQMANNETGVLQPVAEVAALARGAWRSPCTPMRCRRPAASPSTSPRSASTT